MKEKFFVDQSIYVFGWLQGLSIIPDVAGIELQNNTAEEIDEQHDLFIDSEGGIISGSVGSLNKLIVPYSRTTSRTTSESSNLSRNFSTSTGSSNSSLNESIDTNKPTEVRIFVCLIWHVFFLLDFFIHLFESKWLYDYKI